MKKTKPDIKKEETVDYVNKFEKLSNELQAEIEKINDNKDKVIAFGILKLQIIHPKNDENNQCFVHDLGFGTYPPGHSFDIIHKIHETLDD